MLLHKLGINPPLKIPQTGFLDAKNANHESYKPLLSHRNPIVWTEESRSCFDLAPHERDSSVQTAFFRLMVVRYFTFEFKGTKQNYRIRHEQKQAIFNVNREIQKF
jgi:hypothetical protein